MDYTGPIYTEILIRCRDCKFPYLKENELSQMFIYLYCVSLEKKGNGE